MEEPGIDITISKPVNSGFQFSEIFLIFEDIIKLFNKVVFQILEKRANLIARRFLDPSYPGKEMFLFIEDVAKGSFIPNGDIFFESYGGRDQGGVRREGVPDEGLEHGVVAPY